MRSKSRKTDDVRRWLGHIKQNAELARSFIGSRSYADFVANEMVLYAVIRAMEIVSEASRRLPADLADRYPNIPWRDIAGAGSVYRHDYEDVGAKLIWDSVHYSLPALVAAVDHAISKLDNPTDKEA